MNENAIPNEKVREEIVIRSKNHAISATTEGNQVAKDCEHVSFHASVSVQRLFRGKQLTYESLTQVICKDCGLPFCFLPEEAVTNQDQTQLRVTMRPMIMVPSTGPAKPIMLPSRPAPRLEPGDVVIEAEPK